MDDQREVKPQSEDAKDASDAPVTRSRALPRSDADHGKQQPDKPDAKYDGG